MKVPLKWLKDYVDIDIPVNELAGKLTLAGLEVSEIQIIGGSWDKVIVGHILAVNPHPNADRLRLATVDLGSRQITVICGAPNLVVNDKIAFALVGARLIDGHSGKIEELKPAKIRGVVSEGMICAEKELGISDNYEGILVLPQEYEIGRPLSDYLGDVILDIDITPNRADCLSVMGIAREAAAITGNPFRMPDLAYPEAGKEVASYASVEIRDPDLCPRYCASVIDGITIRPSPGWMQDRLAACGARPINNVVDVTNYVMLEFGQPLHAFDHREIKGHKIVVRRAADGEVMYTLDEAERKFSKNILLIADAERAVAVAGIMGGLSSEVRDSTTTILIESANFSQAAIHRGSQELKLGSEASARFEKGLNPELAIMAVKRATQLMAQLGGGKVAQGIIDVYPGKKDRKPIPVSEADVKRTLGMSINEDNIRKCLESLGLHCGKGGKGTIHVDVPWWRNDINITADLVEEVARATGYENIPVSMLSSPLPTGESAPSVGFRRNLQDILVGCGFQEIITYPLTSLDVLGRLSTGPGMPESEPLKISNAMSRELEYLRTSLRIGILSVLARNQRSRENNIRLFEIGKVYLPRPKDLPLESEMLCGLVDSVVPGLYWQSKPGPADFYFAKGVVEIILARNGITADFVPGSDSCLNPAKSADIMVKQARIGVIGEVHPAVLARFDILEPAYMFELDVDRLAELSAKKVIYRAATKYPGIVRDMALLIADDVTYDRISGIISGFSLVSDVQPFDLYAGEQVPAGQKSIALRVTFQSPDHTLTDSEVDAIVKGIIGKLNEQLGASLRS